MLSIINVYYYSKNKNNSYYIILRLLAHNDIIVYISSVYSWKHPITIDRPSPRGRRIGNSDFGVVGGNRGRRRSGRQVAAHYDNEN